MQAFENCPVRNGNKNGCPYFSSISGKCFGHCDLKSDLKCGNCAHWLGDCTTGNNRHEVCGHCYYVIGEVHSHFHTNCPHYTERKQNEPNYVDWIEARAIELGGTPDSSGKSREFRRQARKEWEQAHN